MQTVVRRGRLGQLWWLVERVGGLLLLGAVVFWWGGYVIPQLLALVFPAVIPSEALPLHLNPEYEGTLANTVSAAALLTLTVLALANAVAAHRKGARRIAGQGWVTIAVAAGYLTWEELSDFHITGLTAVERSVFGARLVDTLGTSIWVLLMSPLIVIFAIAVGTFVYKGLRVRIVRGLLILGLVSWLLAVLHELILPLVFVGRADTMEIVIEETLEFSGTLLMALGTALALQNETQSRSSISLFRGQHPFVQAVGAAAAVVVILGSLCVALVFRPPVVDPQADHVDTFELTLRDGEAVMQEFRMPAYPIGSFRLRFASRPPGEGNVGVRVTKMGNEEAMLAEGFVEVPAERSPVWRDVELFPQLAVPEGTKVAVWVAADVGRGADLRLGATQTDRYEPGRLWVNGALTWPDQDLEFVAHGAPEPTRSKFQAIWDLMKSDWRWPVLVIDMTVAITLIVLVTTLLVAAPFGLRSRPT